MVTEEGGWRERGKGDEREIERVVTEEGRKRRRDREGEGVMGEGEKW